MGVIYKRGCLRKVIFLGTSEFLRVLKIKLLKVSSHISSKKSY